MFTGDVVSNETHLKYMVQFDGCKDDTLVYKSELVNFVTEYRVFVSHGKIYGMKHYKGDFLKFIDVSVLENMIKDFTDCPSAFTLDVGLTDDEKNRRATNTTERKREEVCSQLKEEEPVNRTDN